MCQSESAINHSNRERASTINITTVDIDFAKNVVQIHGVDECANTMLEKQLKLHQVWSLTGNTSRCLIGIAPPMALACKSDSLGALKIVATAKSFHHKVRLNTLASPNRWSNLKVTIYKSPSAFAANAPEFVAAILMGIDDVMYDTRLRWRRPILMPLLSTEVASTSCARITVTCSSTFSGNVGMLVSIKPLWFMEKQPIF